MINYFCVRLDLQMQNTNYDQTFLYDGLNATSKPPKIKQINEMIEISNKQIKVS